MRVCLSTIYNERTFSTIKYLSRSFSLHYYDENFMAGFKHILTSHSHFIIEQNGR